MNSPSILKWIQIKEEMKDSTTFGDSLVDIDHTKTIRIILQNPQYSL